ncbi:DUF6625 family protein [Ruminococcus flavefaciens]|uniref:Uncharacterized protein n=1 Tax=Ruminococcus flavefaciens TaxID=1265 RepID=A0A315Y4K1_RUMFL|nr:DUF6625 family protein [Ruminococcus flavefaciens]PWJ14694.1 hypothetical protein IE37_00679 [Ruminococcus flavefaciens]SSA42724.1 hypothetical protein SAMN02910325_00679 [Ruminococcus flavefaciens]
MYYKYKVFCPYFGRLPSNFNLWLASCSYNSNFQFIVITDDDYKKYSIPNNVLMIKMDFVSFKKTVQQKFDFKISLETPYKLCDFKPTYGYVFESYLDDCIYWGYCDMDLVFGDLEKFMPQTTYDKISHLGHLCLYRNNSAMRECFKLNSNSKVSYVDILSNPMHFGFDEIGDYGINNVLIKNEYKIYDYELYVADISCARDGMVLAVYRDDSFSPLWGTRIFAFENGKVYSYDLDNKITKKEYAYVHLQKRKMSNNVINVGDKFLILPCQYCEYQDVTKELIINSQDKHLIPLKMFRVKFTALIKRYKRKQVLLALTRKRNKRNER